MTSQACWCFDEHVVRPGPAAVPANPPPSGGWPHLFAAVLDALLPFQEAYAAVTRVAVEILEQLPGPHHPAAPP